ncbi:unnamed protein product [Symbiodinium sp. CCMP2592]|nr:unnamed protein product [Symbiodinium sp. CCMP2592]
MVSIGTCTTITWQAREVVVPNDLIVEISGVKYLKIQPSNRVCKEGREEAIQNFLKSEGKGSGAESKKKKQKVQPNVEYVMVDGIQIGVQAKHKSTMDLLILLESESLEMVFAKITEDADPDERRVYRRRRAGRQCSSEEKEEDSH